MCLCVSRVPLHTAQPNRHTPIRCRSPRATPELEACVWAEPRSRPLPLGLQAPPTRAVGPSDKERGVGFPTSEAPSSQKASWNHPWNVDAHTTRRKLLQSLSAPSAARRPDASCCPAGATLIHASLEAQSCRNARVRLRGGRAAGTLESD